MGLLGPQGAWSLGAPAALPQETPHRPASPLRVATSTSTGAGRPPLRRLSKSLPTSPTRAQFALGGGEQPHDPTLDLHLQRLLIDGERHRYAGSSASRSSSLSRPPSPAHLHPSRPSSPSYSHSPSHSRSPSRTRFTGRLELPMSPSSLHGHGQQDQQALIARVVELERAYGELEKAYREVEREKKQWKALASPFVAGVGRSGSVSPHGYSPTSSRPPSRPASPAHSHPLKGHGHSHSLSSVASLNGASSVASHSYFPPSQEHLAVVGGGIPRPSSALGRPPIRGLLTMTTAAAGIARPKTGMGRY